MDESARTLEHEIEREGLVWRTWTNRNNPKSPVVVLEAQDPESSISVSQIIPNRYERAATIAAWAGARHSRSPANGVELVDEIWTKEVDADEKMETTVVGYGHASVGDMARMIVSIDNVPMSLPLRMFHIGEIVSGQEKSSRFQKAKFVEEGLFDFRNYLPRELRDHAADLAEEYQSFGRMSVAQFDDMIALCTPRFEDFYHPESDAQRRSMGSRILDTARSLLPLGTSTGFAYETSARDWSRLIGRLRGSVNTLDNTFGDHLAAFLAPGDALEGELDVKAQAPALIRYAEANTTSRENLERIGKFSDQYEIGIPRSEAKELQQDVFLIGNEYSTAEKAAAAHILAARPQLEWLSVLSDIKELGPDARGELGTLIHDSITHHNELTYLSRTNELTFVTETALGEMRDWNRHRASGRTVIGIPQTIDNAWDVDVAEAAMRRGFILPLYVTEVPSMRPLQQRFNEMMDQHYTAAAEFLESVNGRFGEDISYNWAANLFPLGHAVTLFMHEDPRQVSYKNKLRVRPGGHINYRVGAQEMAELAAGYDPLLAPLSVGERPDPANRKEFFDRS